MKLDGDFTNAHLVIPILETDGALQPRTEASSSQIHVSWPGGSLRIHGSGGGCQPEEKVTNRTGVYQLWHLPLVQNELMADFKVTQQ